MAEEEKPKTEGEAAASAAQPDRALNQDEIDTLLGYDPKSENGKGAGINAILDKSLMAYEKLPMLEVVFDRLVRSLSSSLRNFTSDNVDVSIASMTSMRFEEYINGIPLPALIVIFRATEWENFGIAMVDSSLIYTMVDVLLGGRRIAKPVRVEGRAYTTIEQDIVKRMVEILLADMSSAFDPVSPVTFQFERLENNPRFATITRPASGVLLVKLKIDIEGRGGLIEVMLPHPTIEPIRDLLTQMFMGEKFGQDVVWEKHLGKEVRNTHVNVEAVLDEKTVSLGDLMNFKVGNTIMLDRSPNDDITLKCAGVAITSGKLGRIGDHIAISINEAVKRKVT